MLYVCQLFNRVKKMKEMMCSILTSDLKWIESLCNYPANGSQFPKNLQRQVAVKVIA